MRRSMWGALLVTVLVAVLAGAFASRRDSRDVSPRSSKPAAEVKGAVTEAPALVPGGAKPAPPAPRPERMLLVGDSVAFSIKDQLFLAAAAQGISMHNAAVSGCSVIGGVTLDPSDQPWPWAEGCAAGIAKFHSDLVAAVQPQLVVWISSWESVDRRLADGTIVRFGTPDGNKRLMELIDEAAQRLTAGGARLVIVTLAPPPPENKDKHEATVNLPILNELLREYAHEHPDKVFVAEMAEILCGEQICPSVVEGYAPRPDGVHFDDAHSGRWISDQLIPMLLRPMTPAHPRERDR